MKYLLYGLIPGLLFLQSCNNAQQNSQAASDSTQQEEQTETATADDAQTGDESKANRPSPPRTATGNVGDVEVKINYGSPSVKGRQIWGGLVPYGQVWRTGANEATTISFSKTTSVEGKKLAAGKYALFTIPGENQWTVIFNAVAEQWGAYEYDPSKDALRGEVAPRPAGESAEALEFAVKDGEIVLRWEKLEVPIRVAPAS